MAGERKLTVVLAGDATGLTRALGKAEKSTSGLGSKLKGFGKVAAVGLGGAAVAGVAFGKSLIDAATESQKVTKQTEAVIKSMGGAANVTSSQVADLSERLAMQSGVDDELIQSGSNVLLTFGNVRNELGKGPKIFDRATQAALDMSVALGTDMTSASMMVGKALNDPVKGLSKLARSGVQFSKQQEDQIKAMVEVGDTAGAQAIMLKELERQFGGSAKAQSTAGERLQVVWGNLQEELGAKLLPVVEKVASFLADKLPKAFEAIGSLIGPIASQVGMFWNTLTSGFTEDEGTPIEMFALKIREFIPQIQAGVQQVVAIVRQHWPQIQAIIQQVVLTIQQVVTGVLSVVQTLWKNFGDNILAFVQRVWPSIRQTISGALEVIRGVIKVVTSLIKGDWSGVWAGIKNIVHGAFNVIVGRIKMAMELVRAVVGIGLEIVGSMFKSAWNGIVGFFQGIPGRLAAVGGGMFDFIKSAARSALNFLIDGWNRLEFKIPGFDPPGPGPKFGGVTIGVPDIPRLAKGAIVKATPGGILANIGEGRFDEAVMPLKPGMAMGAQQITIDLRGAIVASDVDLERVVRKALQGDLRRNGRIPGTNIVKATA